MHKMSLVDVTISGITNDNKQFCLLGTEFHLSNSH